jgi:FkbM family methyltransferase
MKQLFYKIIYNDTINIILRNLNKLLYPVLPRAIRIAPSGILTIENEGKSLKIKVNQTNYLGTIIFWEGFETFEYTAIFLSLIKKINLFYDIGANIGYYTLLAKLANPGIRVVSFEPASGPLFYLRENIRINDFDNIKAEPFALSDKSGEIDFYEIKNAKYTYLEHCLAGEGNIGSLTTGRNFVVNKVKTMTLDDYVKSSNEGPIDLIKMDTEGTENLILGKSGFILEEMRPIIICETIFNKIEHLLEDILNLYGYEFYNHTKAGLVRTDTIKREVDNGISNCFFVHPSKFHLIEEFITQ